jgi:uncharacterized oligopeptide transporter (OPT) family protein
MPEHVTHTDIYHRLGVIEGAIQGINLQLAQKRDDMSTVFSRLRFIEAKVAVGIGIAIVLSVAAPIVVTAMAPRILFQQVESNQPR